MNRMEEVAKLFGVKMGERFILSRAGYHDLFGRGGKYEEDRS